MNPFIRHCHAPIRGAFRPWGLGGVVVASAVLHGLLLGLPWPLDEQPNSLESGSPPLEEAPTMDVAVLPGDWRTSITEADGSPDPVGDRAQSPAAAPQPGPESTETEAIAPAPASPETTTPTPPDPAPAEEPLPSPGPTPEPAASAPPPETDVLTELPEERGTASATPPPAPLPTSLDERLRTPTAYSFNNKTLSGGESIGALQRWHDRISSLVPEQVLPSKVNLPLEVDYLLTECLDAPPVEGVLGVVMDPEGKVLQGPDVITTTGYDVLDEKAQEIVTTHPFPDRDQVKAYSVTVMVVGYPEQCL